MYIVIPYTRVVLYFTRPHRTARTGVGATVCMWIQTEIMLSAGFFCVSPFTADGVMPARPGALIHTHLTPTSSAVSSTSSQFSQTDRHRRTDTHTETDRQTGKQTDRHTDRQANRQTHTHTETDSHTHTQTETARQTDRQMSTWGKSALYR